SHAFADVPAGRGPRGRPRALARAPQGHAGALRARALRARPRDPHALALLPVHRAERRARRLLFPVRRRRLPRLLGRGLDRDPGRRHGRPQRVRIRPGLRPGGRVRLGLRHGHRACRDAQVRHPARQELLRQRRPLPGAVPRGRAMKVPVQWLSDHLAELPPLDELTERLSLAGDKVESVERRGLPVQDGVEELIVAGHVLEAGKHPNADRLQVCHVDVGEASPRSIVCGAWNFAAGDTVAVALPGTALLDGRRIARSKLRGETSDGMILSERELDISPEGDGIIVLGDASRPGEPLAARLPLAHDVLELEVTSNRADLLSMRGVARDVHAIFGIDLPPPDDSEPPAVGHRLTADWITITIDDEELCPRFTARVFQDVTVGPSPLWLKTRVYAAGMRPISNVVDITNYVMHDLGSPTHVYDHARL